MYTLSLQPLGGDHLVIAVPGLTFYYLLNMLAAELCQHWPSCTQFFVLSFHHASPASHVLSFTHPHPA